MDGLGIRDAAVRLVASKVGQRFRVQHVPSKANFTISLDAFAAKHGDHAPVSDVVQSCDCPVINEQCRTPNRVVIFAVSRIDLQTDEVYRKYSVLHRRLLCCNCRGLSSLQRRRSLMKEEVRLFERDHGLATKTRVWRAPKDLAFP
jgi:hypothetical protein